MQSRQPEISRAFKARPSRNLTAQFVETNGRVASQDAMALAHAFRIATMTIGYAWNVRVGDSFTLERGRRKSFDKKSGLRSGFAYRVYLQWSRQRHLWRNRQWRGPHDRGADLLRRYRIHQCYILGCGDGRHRQCRRCRTGFVTNTGAATVSVGSFSANFAPDIRVGKHLRHR